MTEEDILRVADEDKESVIDLRILDTSPIKTGYNLDTQEADFLMGTLSDDGRKHERSTSNYLKTEILREKSIIRRLDKLETRSGDNFDQVESIIIDDNQNIKEDNQHKYIEKRDNFGIKFDLAAQRWRPSFAHDIQSRHSSVDSSYLSSNESSDNSISPQGAKTKKRK